LVDIRRGPPAEGGDTRPVGHEPPRVRKLPESIDRGQPGFGGQFHYSATIPDRQRINKHDQALSLRSRDGSEGAVELVRFRHALELNLCPEPFGGELKRLRVSSIEGIRRIPQNRHSREPGNSLPQ